VITNGAAKDMQQMVSTKEISILFFMKRKAYFLVKHHHSRSTFLSCVNWIVGDCPDIYWDYYTSNFKELSQGLLEIGFI
jgi:hypothetical protein